MQDAPRRDGISDVVGTRLLGSSLITRARLATAMHMAQAARRAGADEGVSHEEREMLLAALGCEPSETGTER